MDAERDDDIIELIDKIIGYVDTQPLILNHLAVLREAVVNLLTLQSETASNYDTLQAQVGHLHARIEKLESDLQDAQKPTPITLEVIPRRPKTIDPFDL
jgi:hypothetical protein